MHTASTSRENDPDGCSWPRRRSWFGRLAIGLLVMAIGAPASIAAPPDAAKNNGESPAASGKSEEVAIFAGGCFWCTEAVFELIAGVNNVESGYIGGPKWEANYHAVSSHKRPIPGVAMHAEAVRIRFDPNRVAYKKLLEIFFKTHDPTSLYKQGPDIGPQYRTSVFYTNEEQKQIVEGMIREYNESKKFRRPVVTLFEDGTGDDETSTFYLAEELHQDYYKKNPNDMYCRRNTAPKVRKTRNLFEEDLKQ